MRGFAPQTPRYIPDGSVPKPTAIFIRVLSSNSPLLCVYSVISIYGQGLVFIGEPAVVNTRHYFTL